MKEIVKLLKLKLKNKFDKVNKKEISLLLLIINPFLVVMFKDDITFLELIVLIVVVLTISAFLYLCDVSANINKDIPLPNKNFVNKNGDKLTMDECEIYPLMVYFSELYEYFEKEGML